MGRREFLLNMGVTGVLFGSGSLLLVGEEEASATYTDEELLTAFRASAEKIAHASDYFQLNAKPEGYEHEEIFPMLDQMPTFSRKEEVAMLTLDSNHYLNNYDFPAVKIVRNHFWGTGGNGVRTPEGVFTARHVVGGMGYSMYEDAERDLALVIDLETDGTEVVVPQLLIKGESQGNLVRMMGYDSDGSSTDGERKVVSGVPIKLRGDEGQYLVRVSPEIYHDLPQMSGSPVMLDGNPGLAGIVNTKLAFRDSQNQLYHCVMFTDALYADTLAQEKRGLDIATSLR